MNIRIVAIATALSIAVVAVIAVAISLQPQPQARAHDDGTSHIHVTPTPTPPPPLGLNGPLTLNTNVVYDDATRHLVISSHISNPPPEGWIYSYASINIDSYTDHWNLQSHVYGHGEQHWTYTGTDVQRIVVFKTDHLGAEVPLPDYVDFSLSDESVLAKVSVNLQYQSESSNQSMSLDDTLYIDLTDRENWAQ